MINRYLKKYNKVLADVSYSIFAYALPTFALYFIIQPVIVRYISGEENGLFLTMLSVVRYCTNILISSLATLRLMEKTNCLEKSDLNDKFNYLFVFSLLIGVLVCGAAIYYYSVSYNLLDTLLSLLFLVLLFFHDYYSIIFRINIDFKKLSINNALIVAGYSVGLLLFTYTRMWQLVFVLGYLFGSIYVFIQARDYLHIGCIKRIKSPDINKKYIELSLSNGLAYSVVYCDKLLIYPVLGGENVSIYNASGVVSKIISVMSLPIRNVLLSYLVNKTEFCVSKRTVKVVFVVTPVAVFVLTVLFSLIGGLLCKFLYPMFFNEAYKYIPIIVLSIVVNTVAAFLGLILLQFAKTYLQTLLAAIRLCLYLIFVVLLTMVWKLGLWGFCISTLLVSCVDFVLIAILTYKTIIIK